MRRKILIVEDDKMLCTIFQMFVQELDYNVVGIARNSEDAIIATEDNPDIDCILMDILLDGTLNGIDTAKEIGKKFDIPIVFVTNVTDNDVIKSAALENSYGILTKPIHKQSLSVAIEFACSKHNLYNTKNS